MPAKLLTHAASCVSCRQLVDQIRLLDRSVAATPAPDPGELYWDNFRKRVAKQLDHPVAPVIQMVPHVSKWRWAIARLWAPAAAVALLAVIASRETFVPNPPAVDALRESPVSGAYTAGNRPDSDRKVFALVPVQPVFRDSSYGASHEAGAAARIPKPSSHVDGDLESGQSLVKGEGLGQRGNAENLEESRLGSEIAETESRSVVTADDGWPERQITIMGEIDSNTPAEPLSDDKRLTAQDQFAAYERQVMQSRESFETTGTFATPGRLLEGPSAPVTRGADRQTPAEQMRRFDEMAELRDLIARLEAIPSNERALSQWTQLSTAWFRLGMLTEDRGEVVSALDAVGRHTRALPADSTAAAGWSARKAQLETRLQQLKDN